MRTKIHYILLASLILLFATASCSKKKEYNIYCTITGTVIDYETSQAIQGATVTLSPSGMNAHTGDNGYFEFNDLYENQYTISAQKSGYITNRVTVTTVAGGTINEIIELQKDY